MKHSIIKKEIDYQKYKDKLFEIATIHKKIHNEKEIILPKFLEKPFSKKELFFNENTIHILELGSGWGEFLIEWLIENPSHEYIAFEIEAKRIKVTLANLHKKFSTPPHLKIIPLNFSWFLVEILPKESFDIIFINFPDPWPKKRHWKHRLIRDENFINDAYTLLRKNGKIYINTDFGPYARKILTIFRNSKKFKSEIPYPNYLRKHPDNFPYTTFEKLHYSEKRIPYYQCWSKI